MRRIIVFNHVTLDGYFTDANRSMDWAHGKEDAEWNAFVAENAKGGGELLFGRVTYDLMASFWPTPMALKMMPTVAAQMNGLPRVVFSRTLASAAWSNTTVAKGDLVQEVQRMKAAPGGPRVPQALPGSRMPRVLSHRCMPGISVSDRAPRHQLRSLFRGGPLEGRSS